MSSFCDAGEDISEDIGNLLRSVMCTWEEFGPIFQKRKEIKEWFDTPRGRNAKKEKSEYFEKEEAVLALGLIAV